MTIKRTLTVNLGEIKAIEVRCTKCPAAVSFPVDYKVQNFLNCPGCGNNLLDVGLISETLQQVATALLKWKKLAGKTIDVTFTIDLHSESES